MSVLKCHQVPVWCDGALVDTQEENEKLLLSLCLQFVSLCAPMYENQTDRTET